MKEFQTLRFFDFKSERKNFSSLYVNEIKYEKFTLSAEIKSKFMQKFQNLRQTFPGFSSSLFTYKFSNCSQLASSTFKRFRILLITSCTVSEK